VCACWPSGWSNREIARQLSIAVGTAQWHTKSIYRKLGVRNRTRAAALARALGLLA
jgi:ATP/maltotriose-dependent transcriptional regulator MalT